MVLSCSLDISTLTYPRGYVNALSSPLSGGILKRKSSPKDDAHLGRADEEGGLVGNEDSPDRDLAYEKWRQDVRQTMRELRKTLGLTQQQLAVRLEMAVVTVARWETSRPPELYSLLRLSEFAAENRLLEIAHRFTDLAFPDRAGADSWWLHSLRSLRIDTDLGCALVLIMRNQHLRKLRDPWAQVLGAILKALASLCAEVQAGGVVHGDATMIGELIDSIRWLSEGDPHAEPRVHHQGQRRNRLV